MVRGAGHGLAQEGAPIGGEKEGNAELPPPAAGGRQIAELEGAAVALRLLDGRGHVLALALGLHHGERRQTAEEHVVGGAAGGGPLGDGEVPALLRPGAAAVAQFFGVGLPACLAQLECGR